MGQHVCTTVGNVHSAGYSQTKALTADGRKAVLSTKVFCELISFVTYKIGVLMKCFACSVAHLDHLMLFRRFVSRKALGNGRAVLEGVGLDSNTIDSCFNSHPLNEEAAVQAGLVKWRGGQSHKPSTWEVLLKAMEYAQLQQQDIRGLMKELGVFGMLVFISELYVASVCMLVYVQVCVRLILFTCMCACMMLLGLVYSKRL